MGSFYTSLQVRSEDHEGTIDALRNLNAFPVYISKKPINGWISVFPESTEKQDQDQIMRMIESVSRYLETGVFGLLVHDSDVFWYALAESGKLVDVYDSDPDYFGGGAARAKGGKTSALMPYCVSGTTEIDLAQLLHRKREEPKLGDTNDLVRALQSGDMEKLQASISMFNGDDVFRGDSLARRFGERLGLPQQNVCMGYNYLRESRGRVPGMLHVLDPDKRIPEKKAKEGLPLFEPESSMDMAAGMRGMRGLMGLAPEKGRLGEQPVPFSRQPGEELSWVASILNSGGHSQGIKITIAGDLLKEDIFTDMVAYVSKAPSGKPSDEDFELADPEDESYWPYVATFKRGSAPDEVIAELPEFKYEGRIGLQLPFTIAGAGEGSFRVSIEPSTNADGAANFNFDLKAESPKPRLKLVQTEPGAHEVGPVELDIPAEYQVQVRSAHELKMAAIMGGAGLIGQLVAMQGTSKSVSLTIVESTSMLAKKDLDGIMNEFRVKQKMRTFEATPIASKKFGIVEFRYTTWRCPDYGWSGLMASGTIDGETLLFSGQRKKGDASEFEEILNSIRLI